MRRVDSAVARGYLRKLNQLLGLRVERRGVNERCADAYGAVFHCLSYELSHLVEFGGCRSPVLVPEHILAHLRGSNIGGQVDRRMAAFQAGEVFAERMPVCRKIEMFKDRIDLLKDVIIQRSGRPALTCHLGCNRLKDLRFGARVDKQIQLRLAKHIDETWGYNHA